MMKQDSMNRGIASERFYDCLMMSRLESLNNNIEVMYQLLSPSVR